MDGRLDEHDDEQQVARRGRRHRLCRWTRGVRSTGVRVRRGRRRRFGLGSAAPIADGAQPLGHAVKGRRDGRTFVGPDDAGYDDVEPDVWFYNEEAARRAGFHREGE